MRKINPAIKTRVVPFDISKQAPDEYAKLFNSSKNTSIVISNAGIMKNRKFLETSPETIEAMIKTNFHPQIYLTKYAIKHFIETN